MNDYHTDLDVAHLFYFTHICLYRPCGLRRTSVGIEGSNPAEGMDVLSVVFVVRCVSTYFCDGLITYSEECYRLGVPMCDLQGGSNMTGTDLCVNKPHCAAAVRP